MLLKINKILSYFFFDERFIDNRVGHHSRRPRQTVTNRGSRAYNKGPKNLKFPFENLVLEGGGVKGVAYVGVIRYLEYHGLIQNIKRFGGSSAGAMSAASAALGYTSSEMETILEADFEYLMKDGAFGWASLIPNLYLDYGWNPGDRLMDWLGEVIAAKSPTSDPDMTFEALYKHNGAELCIVVTNVNRMCSEYCHPKTTPKMPIRLALRMSMSLPGLMAPVPYNNDLYVDGGMLCNFPIHCFDGWYLSMKEEDNFFRRILPSDEFLKLIKGCFDEKNPKTLGCVIYQDHENQVMRYDLDKRPGIKEPRAPSPETALYLRHKEKVEGLEAHQKSYLVTIAALSAFFKAINRNNKGDLKYITKEEFLHAFEDTDDFPEKMRRTLFKEKSADEVFELFDFNNNGLLGFEEFCQYFEKQAIVIHGRMDGCSRIEINNIRDFFWYMKDNLVKNAGVRYIVPTDEMRTIGINTGHINTQDFSVEPADREFLYQRGYNATKAFMKTLI